MKWTFPHIDDGQFELKKGGQRRRRWVGFRWWMPLDSLCLVDGKKSRFRRLSFVVSATVLASDQAGRRPSWTDMLVSTLGCCWIVEGFSITFLQRLFSSTARNTIRIDGELHSGGSSLTTKGFLPSTR